MEYKLANIREGALSIRTTFWKVNEAQDVDPSHHFLESTLKNIFFCINYWNSMTINPTVNN